MPQQVLSVVMAGRSGGEPMLAAARAGISDPWHASLREDYLNQVQRDFLSRARRPNTPSIALQGRAWARILCNRRQPP